jgi:RHS repeat-associated protein
MPGSNVYNGKNQDTRAGYNYDAAGNLLYLNGNSATYDAENRLTALTAIGGASETILYDAAGQRVQKSYGGSSTVYVYDAFGRLAAEYANGTTWSRDYIFDGTGFVVASENASGLCTTCYFGYDHLGSVRIVMDQHGSVVGRHDFLPFGEELLGTAGRTTAGFNVTADVTQKFTGQIRDQESGEDFFNARYFTAGLGRFNSADPGNAGASLGNSQSWNGYGYVLGNPLALVDPSGMCTSPDGGTCYDATAKLCKWWQFWCWGGSSGGTPEDFDQFYASSLAFLNAGPSCSNCGGGHGGTTTNKTPPAPKAGSCIGGAGAGIGGGYNVDLGVGVAGASSTAGVGAGVFRENGSGGNSNSAGAFASGGAAVYSGSKVSGIPAQNSKTVFSVGAYGGVGANIFFTNAGSVQQLKGPFTTVSVNVGIEIANLGVQVSFGGGLWSVSVTPPIVSFGGGAAASVITTNTVTTKTGCNGG